MAQYKVPQDVEADDKLLGPFNFRQFVYLLIAGGLIALAVGLFQLFPLLAIIPLPFVLFFLALALPLKKDQPMETYLAAIVSFYLKPRNRIWLPGQRESAVLITAPKVVKEERTRDITSDEATHRLSFLANIVDTGGYAIKGMTGGPMRDDLYAEANSVVDMLDPRYSYSGEIDNQIARGEQTRHAAIVQEMQQAISENENFEGMDTRIRKDSDAMLSGGANSGMRQPSYGSSAVVQPKRVVEKPVDNFARMNGDVARNDVKNTQTVPKNSIIELANNPDYSVATLAKEASRINRKEEGEVFISLH